MHPEGIHYSVALPDSDEEKGALRVDPEAPPPSPGCSSFMDPDHELYGHPGSLDPHQPSHHHQGGRAFPSELGSAQPGSDLADGQREPVGRTGAPARVWSQLLGV